MKLARMKMTMDSVPAKDQQVSLLDNANLSTGGEAVEVTDKLSPAFQQIALSVTHQMNLRYCGVDLITTNPIDAEVPRNFTILEINAAPGLDHYARLGQTQVKHVKDLYRKVLEAFKRD